MDAKRVLEEVRNWMAETASPKPEEELRTNLRLQIPEFSRKLSLSVSEISSVFPVLESFSLRFNLISILKSLQKTCKRLLTASTSPKSLSILSPDTIFTYLSQLHASILEICSSTLGFYLPKQSSTWEIVHLDSIFREFTGKCRETYEKEVEKVEIEREIDGDRRDLQENVLKVMNFDAFERFLAAKSEENIRNVEKYLQKVTFNTISSSLMYKYELEIRLFYKNLSDNLMKNTFLGQIQGLMSELMRDIVAGKREVRSI